MKLTHIVLLVVIAVAIGVIVSMTGNTSTYVTFNEAKEMSAQGQNEKIHVVGRIKKSPSGSIEGMEYHPELDPNFFKFQLVDTTQTEMTVIYSEPKPADFERSEQIVIIGSVKNGVFVANKILMKCPSKYTEKEIKVG
jgi:cytochrome c-type biogenesis protein CcmE